MNTVQRIAKGTIFVIIYAKEAKVAKFFEKGKVLLTKRVCEKPHMG
jgi:hypothetical protein